MADHSMWERRPTPDKGLVAVAERLLEAAKLGHVKVFAITTANPVHEVETVFVGNLDKTACITLVGGLARAIHHLNELIDQIEQSEKTP